MVSLTSLWLPILLSAVAVFITSSVIHMFLKYHHTDYSAVPAESAVRDALRPFNIPPGDYNMPRPGSAADMRTPEFREKLNKGPVIMMTVMPNGPFSMGANLAQWFVYTLVVGLFAGYIASHALTPGTAYLEVFRFVGATAFLGYALALWQDSIWYKRKWSTTIKNTFDGLVYALVTASVFGWLWPK